MEEVAVCNLPAHERFDHKNLLLIGASRASVYKDLGMARVISGVDKEGNKYVEPSHAADMTRLHHGVVGKIPDDMGGWREIELHAWDLTLAGDMLNLNASTPYNEAPGAHKCCRKCDHDTRHPLANRPFSFHREVCDVCDDETTETNAPPTRGFNLRTLTTLQAQLDTLRGCTSAAQIKELCGSYGIKSEKIHAYAWDPDYIPLANPTDIPEDGLHLFGDGVLRSEGAWLVYDLCRNGGLKFGWLFKVCFRYKGYPPDVKVPKLHPKLLKGAAGGVPKSDAVLRMTGSQVHHFTLHR
jgi:hypothetical protein